MKKLKLFCSVSVWATFILFSGTATAQFNAYDIATASGVYNYSYTQVPGNLVPVYAGNTGTAYVWESSTTPLFNTGTVTTVGTAATYNISSALSQTTYYRRKTTIALGISITSNVIKIQVGSQSWQDINYVRENDVLISGQTDWKTIDQLPVGQKLQTTTYLDGLGRPLEKVDRETAAPQNGGSQWGDIVQFSQYDAYGREPKKYLPYSTTNQLGYYKTTATTDQAAYYSNTATYNETSPYANITYDNSPLNRVTNVKSPGTSWAAGAGNSEVYDMNDAADNVQIFTIGYNAGDYPTSLGAYPAYTLVKTTHLDEYGKQVIEYTDNAGHLILTKTQIDAAPSAAHSGWICTYSVYDDFGLLRYRIQPEAVKYLDANGWTFAGTNGQQVLNEFCYRYDYDSKGRNILKKAPGVKALTMMYDSRDRVVFMQDGNQSDKTPNQEWTANLYDDLDRLILTTLYRPAETAAQLQTDIDNAVTSTSVSVVNPNQPVTNLVLDNRVSSVASYSAQQSIEFVPGFSSGTNDAFVAQIDPNATQSTTVTTVTYGNPITAANLNNSSVSTIIKYLFYDDYSYNGAKSFDNNFDNAQAYPAGTDVMPVANSKRTLSFPTGSLVRVLGTNTFLASTVYYDEKGRQIQTNEDNIKSGKDVTTLQYQWDGRLLSSDTKHTTANTGYENFGILTKNIFDKIGRIISIQKKYGSNDFKTIASYDLDDMGRLKTKHLDPGYTGSGKSELESLAYTYNIQNNITGINKDYALKTPGKYDKWGNYFGLYLGYDNRDGVFNAGRLDGHVTGLLWNTQGDDNQRKYDYTYDNAGRLTKADFREKATPTDAWNNSKLDFTVGGSGTNSTIQYDNNGNLISMFQKGVLIGGSGPVNIDDLHYAYASFSNKLTKVTDNSTTGASNGTSGDFKDGTNSGDDYVYDDNGNLIIDLNKNATNATGGVTTPLGTSGITYNFLDKPETIRITGKGTINILYDADGNKLQRTYTPDGGTAKVTTYINEFVYQGDALQYINFEEGRIRVATAVSTNNGYDGLTIDGNMDLPNGKRGAYDYFIRDYQQNVRMILTEETHYGINKCTMETSRAANEEPFFGQSGANNEVATTRFTKPSGWASNTSGSVSRLSKLSGHTIGPNSLLKVMAGDVLNASADYYYPAAVTNNHNSLVSDIVSAFVQAISTSTVTPLQVHGNTANISTNLTGDGNFSSITDPNQATSDQVPRAYLNIVFFDERFNFVKEGSIAVRVSQPGDGAAPLVLPLNIKAPKNGYAYIYLSNENDDAVYFDNFTVSDTRGRIIEENHYYAFGLKIASISSVKMGDVNEGSLKNNYQYQGDFSEMDEDIGWNDFELRNYDAQTGRWVQQDPFDQFTSPYTGMGNDPIDLIDPSGGIGIPCPGTSQLAIFFAKAGETIGKVASSIGGINSLVKVGIDVAKVGDEIYNNSVEVKIINRQLVGNMTLQAGSGTIPPDEFDQNGNKISNLGGDKIDFYHQANGDTRIVDRASGASNIIVGGESLIRNYSHRNKGISWATIYNEFKQGTGPIKSLISDFDNSNEGPFGSLHSYLSSYASLARNALLTSTASKGIIKMDYGNANPFLAQDMWEQMWGRTDISWYKLGDQTLFLMTDSKSRQSLLLRKGKSWERSPKNYKYGNTYQTYLWIESNTDIRNRVNEHDAYYRKQILQLQQQIRSDKF